MRFLDYIKLSSNGDDAEFRSMSLRLVKDKTKGIDIIEKLSVKYSYINDAIKIRDNLNSILKVSYKGNYRYDFCIDEGETVDKLRINKMHKEKVQLKSHVSNNELTELKKRFEIDISKIDIK